VMAWHREREPTAEHPDRQLRRLSMAHCGAEGFAPVVFSEERPAGRYLLDMALPESHETLRKLAAMEREGAGMFDRQVATLVLAPGQRIPVVLTAAAAEEESGDEVEDAVGDEAEDEGKDDEEAGGGGGGDDDSGAEGTGKVWVVSLVFPEDEEAWKPLPTQGVLEFCWIEKRKMVVTSKLLTTAVVRNLKSKLEAAKLEGDALTMRTGIEAVTKQIGKQKLTVSQLTELLSVIPESHTQERINLITRCCRLLSDLDNPRQARAILEREEARLVAHRVKSSSVLCINNATGCVVTPPHE
jgi:hypothetical protein